MTYAKFILALSAALGVAVSLTVDGNISLNDALAILAAAVGALAVGVVPNKQPGLDGDRGDISLRDVVLVLAAVALVLGIIVLWKRV